MLQPIRNQFQSHQVLLCLLLYSLTHLYLLQGSLQFKMKAGKNKELDSLLINLNQNPESPNFELANVYRNRHSLRQEKLTFFGVEEYSKFGPGVKLYFSLLKYMVILFLVLSIAALPSLIVNYHGNGLSLYGNSWQQTFLRFSLANQESLDLAIDSMTLEQQITKARDVKFNQIIIIFNDIFCSCILLAFLIFWKIKSKTYISQLVSKNAPPSYHTLLVDLPNDFQEERLQDHFSQFGHVHQIEYVRDYGDFLLELKELIDLVQKYGQELNPKQKNKLYDEIEERYLKIKKFYRSINQQGEGNPFPRIKAFISFEDHDLAQRVHGLYKYNLRSMNLSMDGKVMKVRKCLVEPLSIIWENYHLKDHSQYLRSCFFIVSVGVLLLITLFGIFVLSLHSNGMTKDSQSFAFNNAQQNITFSQAQKSNSSSVVFSFCASLTYKTFQWRYYDLCADYFKRFQQHWIYIGTLAFVVAAVTLILIKVVFKMTQLRRFRTLPQKRRFMILSIFITYLVSSSLLTLLIRAEINWGEGSFSLVKWAQESFPELAVKNNLDVYNEMTRKWYMQIGKLLLANYFLTLNLFPWLYVIEQWAMQMVRSIWARQASTQKIMNKRILDREFYWQFYYSVQLNCVYFCLFFSTAIPLFYVLTFFSILSVFLTNKIIFCYFTKKPQVYDHKLNSFIAQAIAVSLVLHQFASIYTITVNQIFPQNEPELMSFTGIKILYLLFAFMIILVLINLKRISELVQKKIFGKREQLMITQEINSTFGADRNEKRLRANRHSPIKRRNSYLSSYKMQDNPYYNNISYTLLILDQVISDRPIEALPSLKPKLDSDKLHSTSLIIPSGSKSMEILEHQSQRNLSF